MSQFVAICILEGAKASTEINFFEPLLKILKTKFQNITFLDLLTINGNQSSEKKFSKEIHARIKGLVELKTNQKFNANLLITIICIWDSQKRSNNLDKNFNFIKTKNVFYQAHKFILAKGIEMGLFRYFFKDCNSIDDTQKLTKIIGYKKFNSFKKRNNKLLFRHLVAKANLDCNEPKFINDLIQRLKTNNEKNLSWILTFIQELDSQNQ